MIIWGWCRASRQEMVPDKMTQGGKKTPQRVSNLARELRGNKCVAAISKLISFSYHISHNVGHRSYSYLCTFTYCSPPQMMTPPRNCLLVRHLTTITRNTEWHTLFPSFLLPVDVLWNYLSRLWYVTLLSVQYGLRKIHRPSSSNTTAC